jgi:hypothetical protein
MFAKALNPSKGKSYNGKTCKGNVYNGNARHVRVRYVRFVHESIMDVMVWHVREMHICADIPGQGIIGQMQMYPRARHLRKMNI